MAKIGNRLACDKCGRIESSKLKVFPLVKPTEKMNHICENCRQQLYYDNITVVTKND
ncbi:hypothetical protein [Candidatus Hodarchaeum mangrovi]